MPGPTKITLAQAKRQGDLVLQLWCENLVVYCYNKGEMRLDDAIARWGAARRLDQLPARCTRCGAKEFVDVRARPARREGGNPGGRVVEV